MPAGRPTKLTTELQETICKAIRAGAYIETAAQFAGIDKPTLYLWMKKGHSCSSGRNPYAQFLNAVEKALADAEMRDVLVIDKAGQEGNWQASAWRLERKFPKKWGRKDTLRIKDEFTDLSDDELIARAAGVLGAVVEAKDADTGDGSAT